MKKTVVSIFILSVLLLTAFWQPAFASSETDNIQLDGAATTVNADKLPKLTTNNRTGQQFTLTLQGPKTYYLKVPTGKTSFEVEQGKYTYSYYACGSTQTGQLSVKKKGLSVKYTCDSKKDKETKVPKLTVNNNTGETFRITLSGPKTYYLSLQKGKAKFEVAQGKYNYSYTACGGPQSGTVNVKKKGGTLKLACPKSSQKGSKLIKVTINNQTGGSIIINLTGAKSYYFNIAPGQSKIEVEKGKYNYTAWGCGGASSSGTKNIKGKFVWKWYCK